MYKTHLALFKPTHCCACKEVSAKGDNDSGHEEHQRDGEHNVNEYCHTLHALVLKSRPGQTSTATVKELQEIGVKCQQAFGHAAWSYTEAPAKADADSRHGKGRLRTQS